MNIRAKIYGGSIAAEEPLLKVKKPRGAKAETLGSIEVPRETRRATNSRGEDRHRLSEENARITHRGRDIEIGLVNLSGGGAMVTGSFSPKLWDRVELHLGSHGTIECAVRWIRGDRIGLEFAHETRLDWPSDQVAIVLRHVIERTFPHIQFPESGEPEPAPTKAADQRTDELRSAPRHPLIWNGTLHHDFQSDAVRIRNISTTGAMIETSAEVRVGAEPLLELGETVSVPAIIEWAVGDQVGLRFHAPFDMELLAQSRPTVISPVLPPPDYCEEGPGSDDRWGRLTLSQLRQELEGFLKR